MLGELFLYDEDGNMINVSKYYSVEERKKIMRNWEMAFGGTGYYIQIYPRHNSNQPIAKYNNIQVYDYEKQKKGHGI